MNVRATRLATNALAGACGVLLLLAVVQYAGWGRGYHWADDGEGAAARAPVGAIDRQPIQMPPFSSFAAIEAHPLFNEDREPTPLEAAEGEEAAPPPSPLNVALTGVILDEKNDIRVAMLQDKARNESIALRVGMPLEGDQASWTLVEVKPRSVVFRNSANETSEIELETAVPPPTGAKRPVRSPARPPNAAPATAKGAAKGSGEDLARRIEERRRQMREDAERLRKGQKPARPPKK
jgi:general secretion pathway protein N